MIMKWFLNPVSEGLWFDTVIKSISMYSFVVVVGGVFLLFILIWCTFSQDGIMMRKLRKFQRSFNLERRPRFNVSTCKILWEKAKGKCPSCHKSLGSLNNRQHVWDVDHVIPWSLGGSDHLSNLRALCRSCNTAKSNRTEAEFSKYKETGTKKKRRKLNHKYAGTKKNLWTIYLLCSPLSYIFNFIVILITVANVPFCPKLILQFR